MCPSYSKPSVEDHFNSNLHLCYLCFLSPLRLPFDVKAIVSQIELANCFLQRDRFYYSLQSDCESLTTISHNLTFHYESLITSTHYMTAFFM